MVVAEQVLDVEGHPCVVVDRAVMEYRVVTSDTDAAARERNETNLLRRITRRPNTVTVRALHELSLVVERGESVGIIGRNGSGKSTLMKLICGQVRPSSGAVFASSTPIMLGVNAALVGDLSGQQKVEVDFSHKDVPQRVPPEIALCLFRVMQEALHNAVRHSGVRQFAVQLEGTSSALRLTVRDEGVGFDAGTTASRGLGLTSMKERLKLVGGTLSIQSQLKQGSTIVASVPFQPRAN